MTRAVLFEDAAGRITGVSVKGHSGYAEEGSDIVCAGISTLLITIDQALCSLVGLSPIEHGGEDGFAEVLLPPGITDKQMEQAAAAVWGASHRLFRHCGAVPRVFSAHDP